MYKSSSMFPKFKNTKGNTTSMLRKFIINNEVEAVPTHFIQYEISWAVKLYELPYKL